MRRAPYPSLLWPLPATTRTVSETPPCHRAARAALGVSDASPEMYAASLPFVPGDTTAGSESELQTAVLGNEHNVDLPLHIRNSNFFANVIKHALARETPKKAITAIETYLTENPGQVWENSWICLPLKQLNSFALRVLNEDMRADRSCCIVICFAAHACQVGNVVRKNTAICACAMKC